VVALDETILVVRVLDFLGLASVDLVDFGVGFGDFCFCSTVDFGIDFGVGLGDDFGDLCFCCLDLFFCSCRGDGLFQSISSLFTPVASSGLDRHLSVLDFDRLILPSLDPFDFLDFSFSFLGSGCGSDFCCSCDVSSRSKQ